MREQAVVQKVGNRSGMVSGRRSSGNSQKPARRERSRAEKPAERFRTALRYLPAILKLSSAVVIGLLLFSAYRAAASASFFEIRKVEVQGISHTTAAEVDSTVRREVSKIGVWNADLQQLSSKLQQLPWVRKAVVSRVLPDGVRVRIVERVPVAVVRTSTGRFRWIDEDAVMLGEMGSSDQMPTFFLRGLTEDDSETARKENVERVASFLQLQRECDAAGVSERVSEINVADLRDVRAQLAGNDSQIEMRLGGQNPGSKLIKGLGVLDEQRKLPNGEFISYIDLSQKKRAVIGFVSGARVSTPTADTVENERAPEVAVSSKKEREKPVSRDSNGGRSDKPKPDKSKKPDRR